MSCLKHSGIVCVCVLCTYICIGVVLALVASYPVVPSYPDTEQLGMKLIHYKMPITPYVLFATGKTSSPFEYRTIHTSVL